VDGADQAVQHRAFRWVSTIEARASVATRSDHEIVFKGDHDGYSRLGVVHRREVHWRPRGGWLVIDSLEGSSRHLVEVRWLLAGSVELEQGLARLMVDGRAVLAIATSPQPDTLDILTGRLEPILGWRSRSYGNRRPAPMLVARYQRTLPLVVETLLCPIPDGDAAAALTIARSVFGSIAP
jgi:hypothetical protein